MVIVADTKADNSIDINFISSSHLLWIVATSRVMLKNVIICCLIRQVTLGARCTVVLAGSGQA